MFDGGNKGVPPKTGVAGGEAGIGVGGAEVLCFERKLYFCGA